MTAPSSAWRCWSAWFADDERNLASGLGLVIVVGRPRLGGDGPELCSLGGCRDARAHLVHLVAIVDRDVGILQQVEIPLGVLWCPAPRTDDNVAVTVFHSDERTPPQCTGLASYRAEDDARRTAEVVTI